MFSVGMKVVCIETGSGVDHAEVRESQIYTVRSVGDDGDPHGYWIRLAEIKNPVCVSTLWDGSVVTQEPVYSASRFRPIVERKTSIEIFKKMLTPTEETV